MNKAATSTSDRFTLDNVPYRHNPQHGAVIATDHLTDTQWLLSGPANLGGTESAGNFLAMADWIGHERTDEGNRFRTPTRVELETVLFDLRAALTGRPIAMLVKTAIYAFRGDKVRSPRRYWIDNDLRPNQTGYGFYGKHSRIAVVPEGERWLAVVQAELPRATLLACRPALPELPDPLMS